ncbi:hypothetical protein ABLG96_13610 [Nakamurella sp. A5-74]|uniref:Uncharacterized protein n=1 Tax=Nakamurella sp. A5-74 TaxID=3158264 RepID=A0AAU8DJD9_9ACTN
MSVSAAPGPPDPGSPPGRLLGAVQAALPELGARFVEQYGQLPVQLLD